MLILDMEPRLFNQECRYLSQDRMVRVWLVTGGIVEGFPLRHTQAGARDGSLELETNRGLLNLLSSSIEKIELISDIEA
jgi:hypothetical protein